MSAKEKTDLKKDFITSVAGYPYITRDGLAESYFLQHVFEGETVADNKAAIEKIDPKTIKIRQEGFSVLPGSASDGPIVPVYEIAFRTLDDKKEYIFNERYAVISYGSNTSPEVLARKFGPQNYAGNVYCPILMVDVADHSVVESACISAAGNVPVTLLQMPGSQTRVGLSFYRECQLRQMTQTEPNYDLVLLNNKNILSLNGTPIECQAMAYESIWGGLLRDGQLLHNDALTHDNAGDIQRISTLEAMKLAYDYVMQDNPLKAQWLKVMNATIQKQSFENWIDSLRAIQAPDMDSFNLERSYRRLAANTLLAQHSFARNLDATVLKAAAFENDRIRIKQAIKFAL